MPTRKLSGIEQPRPNPLLGWTGMSSGEDSLGSLARLTPQPGPSPHPQLTLRVSSSLRAWLSCFSSSAILAMESFSASRSRSVSCGTSTW